MRQGQPTSESTIRPFVLLWHELPAGSMIAPHWDLMIQSGDRLATWRILSDWSKTPRQMVEQIGDHRLAYLDFQGPLSNNRGTVRQVARGKFHVLRWIDDDIVGELNSPAGITAIHLSRTTDEGVWMLEVSAFAPKHG